ncbi:hypothetical protein [Alcanivorax quisquiliarum]|uniref:Uncharacterized protein n=1 Tax=Alcanivorax quisquiliarum TaxID=2933565 RepID=A0ABT0E3K4_9GAMM|nr:hypothetical protein [Alcanivorax quisquiliarum]MCK0536389.1 hypothetical protein [Alcanivorax quisquiliarum]
MLRDLMALIRSYAAQSFIRQSREALYHPGYPFCSYLGINYAGDRLINAKFYVTGFRQVPASHFSGFFPCSDAILDAYATYRDSRVYTPDSMGFVLVKKLALTEPPMYTFGMRMPGDLNPAIDQPGLEHEDKVVDDYLAIEASGQKRYRKHYYILKQRRNIETLLQRFAMETRPDAVNLLEYSTFQHRKKILAAMTSVDETEGYLARTGSPAFLAMHAWVTRELGLIPVSPGRYLGSDVRSIHYFEPGEGVYFRDSFALDRLLEKLAADA